MIHPSVRQARVGLSACAFAFSALSCGESPKEESAWEVAPPARTTPDAGDASQGPAGSDNDSPSLANPGSPPAGSDEDELISLPDPPPAMSSQPPEEEEVEVEVTQDCARTEASAVDTTVVQPADIIIAIDTSRSMDAEAEFVQSYMNEFSQQIIDSGIDVRVILIANPTGGSDSDDRDDRRGRRNDDIGLCIDAPLGSGSCPEDTNLPTYLHVDTTVGSNDGLNVIIETFDEWRDQLRPEASKSLVIVTDDDATDGPNDSADEFIENFGTLDPQLLGEWTFSGIFCGMDCDEAAAIGTVYRDLVAATNGVAGELCLQDFQPVFDRLAEEIITNAGSEIACEWEFPVPPEGKTFSSDLVEVRRTRANGDSVTLTRVAGEGECTDAAWYYDDPVSPSKIFACEQTCEAIQGDVGGRIDVVFGCEVIDGCAASAADISAEEGSSCQWPLPPAPDGTVLDHDSVNVRYTNAAGVGVLLGKVSDADECADVEGGWYYDDPDAPSAIVVCPTTCDLLQDGGTNVQALFGCDSKPAERTDPR